MTVKVRIFGQEYTIRSDAPAEYVEEVARLVDERMHAVAEALAAAGTLNIAVLAAMNLADDYLKAKERAEGAAAEYGARAHRLLQVLEKAAGSTA